MANPLTVILLCCLLQQPGGVGISPPVPKPEPPPAGIPLVVKVKTPALAILKAGTKDAEVTHWVWDKRQLPDSQVYVDKSARQLIVGGPGVHYVSCIEVLKGTVTQTDYVVVFEGLPPPPAPTPGPGPAPIPAPASGFRVLFVAESNSNLTREQLNILYSTQIISYLNAKTAKDGDGPGWRKYDPQQDVSNEHEVWKRIWTDTKPALGPLPQVVIYVDQKGTAYPLPATEAETLSLLKKFGGP